MEALDVTEGFKRFFQPSKRKLAATVLLAIAFASGTALISGFHQQRAMSFIGFPLPVAAYGEVCLEALDRSCDTYLEIHRGLAVANLGILYILGAALSEADRRFRP